MLCCNGFIWHIIRVRLRHESSGDFLRLCIRGPIRSLDSCRQGVARIGPSSRACRPVYCGAGLGVALLRRLGAGLSIRVKVQEAALGRQDFPSLAGAIVAGGVVGPLLLMFGLAQTEAATGSLLLMLEGAATAMLAWFLFRENFDRRIALGMVCLVAGAAVLSWSGTPKIESVIGPLAIIGACLAWGLDNNLTCKVSLSDPLQIVELKGLIAGPVNLALGLWVGGSIPPTSATLIAGAVGFLGYNVSLVLFVYALRHLGAARTGAYFSTAFSARRQR